MKLRIIDKNKDFYDYLQNVYRDGSITFDRTDSFLLTKEIMCDYLYGVEARSRWYSCNNRPYDHFVLLQVCNTFWLFLLQVTRWNDTCGREKYPADYTIESIISWRNYKKECKLISLDIISFSADITRTFYSRTRVSDSQKRLVQAVDICDYKINDSINAHTIYRGDGTDVTKHIPLLKACGISNCIDPLSVYLSFEEYFSLKRTSSERTSSAGITDKEKIENHGFNVKTSFRGKQ